MSKMCIEELVAIVVYWLRFEVERMLQSHAEYSSEDLLLAAAVETEY
jgi:hypothetical protein